MYYCFKFITQVITSTIAVSYTKFSYRHFGWKFLMNVKKWYEIRTPPSISLIIISVVILPSRSAFNLMIGVILLC